MDQIQVLQKRLDYYKQWNERLRNRIDSFRREYKQLAGLAGERLSNAAKIVAYKTAGEEVLVDFDGTLSTWNYPNFGLPTDGAREAMRELQRRGYRIIIWTARMDRGIYPPDERDQTRLEIEAWLTLHDIPFDEVDMGVRGKRLAAFVIDDKNILFRGDWDEVLVHARVLQELNDEKAMNTREVYGDLRGDRPGARRDWRVPPGFEWERDGGDDVQGPDGASGN